MLMMHIFLWKEELVDVNESENVDVVYAVFICSEI